MLTTLIPWPYRVLAILLLALATYGFGCLHGLRSQDADQLRGVIAETAKNAKAEKQARVATTQAAARVEVRKEVERIVYRDIVKEVVKYAETDAGRAVCAGPEFVREHNRAANPEAGDPPAGGEPAGPAWEPSNAETLAVITNNYATCNRWRLDLIGWQEWYHATGLEDR